MNNSSISAQFKQTFQKFAIRLFVFLKKCSIKIRKKQKERSWQKKLDRIIKSQWYDNNFQLNDSQEKEIDQFFKNHGTKIDNRWHKVYTYLSGNYHKNFIPDHLFYLHIEPHFNDFSMFPAFMDKNIYQRFYPDVTQPETILRCMNHQFFDEQYNTLSVSDAGFMLQNRHDEDEWMIKPSIHSGKGKNIQIMDYNNDRLSVNGYQKTLSDLKKDHKGNFIIQQKLKQHKILSQIHPDSVNTIRIMTLRWNNQIHVLSAFARFGINGNILDNIGSGGIGFGLNEAGYFSKYGLDYQRKRDAYHPNFTQPLNNYKFPEYQTVIDTVVRMHQQTFYFDLISWDMTVNQHNTPVFIEYNLQYQAINFHQVFNGPLFGELTDDILKDVFSK